MATESRQPATPVKDQLYNEAHRFEFFQAVRLLEWIHRERSRDDSAAARSAVGGDNVPAREVVRFQAVPSFSFPAAAITDVGDEPSSREGGKDLVEPPHMHVAFMGLTGPMGALPEHYTELLIRRIRAKDFALRDFLDLFNHRSISLFYRAWAKYRLPIAFERARVEPDAQDLFTESLRCLIGFGTAHLRQRLEVTDDVLLFYAGHFCHRPRSAVALQSLLGEYLEIPVRVEQFQGHWLYLSQEQQTCLPSAARPAGQYHQLGIDTVVGDQVWDVASMFRLRLGPMSYAQFTRFMPSGDRLLPLFQLTRTYVGVEFDFDAQLILRADQVPYCRLDNSETYEPRLGWNTWLSSRPFTHDAEDAVFRLRY